MADSQSDVRKEILKRIEEIRVHESGFPKNTMKWGKFIIKDHHISDFDFSSLNAIDLVMVFEMIVRAYYRPM